MVLQKEDSETTPTLGIQLMMKLNFMKEKETNQSPQLEDHPSSQGMLSFFCQENSEEEELLYWNLLNQEIF